MKRFLAVAVVFTGLALFAATPDASAADTFYGGHGYGHGGSSFYSGGHGYSSGYGHYAPSYGYGSHHGTILHNRGRWFGHRSGYAPVYRSYGHGGGLHLGVGRIHLGTGGHH